MRHHPILDEVVIVHPNNPTLNLLNSSNLLNSCLLFCCYLLNKSIDLLLCTILTSDALRAVQLQERKAPFEWEAMTILYILHIFYYQQQGRHCTRQDNTRNTTHWRIQGGASRVAALPKGIKWPVWPYPKHLSIHTTRYYPPPPAQQHFLPKRRPSPKPSAGSALAKHVGLGLAMAVYLFVTHAHEIYIADHLC